MFYHTYGYKTQCSHYSALFNLQACPLAGFILLFCPSMECFYHTMDIRLNVRITQPCSISRLILSLDSSCVFCPEHGMFLSYHGYKTQCSHHSASFNLRHILSLDSSCIFVPDSLSVPIIPCSLSCSKYFASEKADIKAGTVSSPLLYLPSPPDVSVSLMFLGFKKLFVSFTTTPLKANMAIIFRIAIRPLKISAMVHTALTVI